MKHLTTLLLTLLVLGGCTETNPNTNDTANELKPSWDAALECTNEKYAREKTFGWYQENYIFLDRKNMKVFEYRAKFSTKREGLLWASEYGGHETGLFNYDNDIVNLSRYRWVGRGEFYRKYNETDRMVLNRETLVLIWKAFGYGDDEFEQICELSTVEKLKAKIEIVEADNIIRLEEELNQKEREKAEQLKRNKI